MNYNYFSYQEHLNFEMFILSKNQESSFLYLEVGEYVYPFQMVLPMNIPTSFEHSIGITCYSIKGTVNIPW